jgi:hypothetical protein
MDQFDTALLTGIQKSNYLDVHERYALHIKPNRGAFDAGLFPQFLEMFRSNSPNQPDQGSAPIRVPFDFQSHS